MGKHEKKSKKHKDKKHKHKRRRSSSSSSSSEDEWVEKKTEISDTKGTKEDTLSAYTKATQNIPLERDEWMSASSLFATTSHLDRRKERTDAKLKEKEANKYDPRNNARELNPYWKDGGDGLPSLAKRKFAKPSDDDDYESYKKPSSWRKSEKSMQDDLDYKRKMRHSNWRENKKHNTKNIPESTTTDRRYSPPKSTVTDCDNLTEEDTNDIAAKLIKAEILGQTEKVAQLKEKLELARRSKKIRGNSENEVILTRTDSRGFTKPLSKPDRSTSEPRQRMETHETEGRLKYYPDDDKYSLKEMFENAKFDSTSANEKEFLQALKSTKNMEDLDDTFIDQIRNEKSTAQLPRKLRDQAITEYGKEMRTLENCYRCIQNVHVQKHLMISMGETIYLSLPHVEPLTEHDCLIIPVRHVSCSTQLDENEWSELTNFRKCLTNMFASRGEDVIFYETLLSASMRSHMVIRCVPLPKEQGDLAPIYFKKAIDECDTEWSTNKKLIKLDGKDVRRAVPKGLPYFFVSFGMNEGFAHIIEDKRIFPRYFGAEVIGGILDLPPSKWRNPHAQSFELQQARVLSFSKIWTDYDCTKNG